MIDDETAARIITLLEGIAEQLERLLPMAEFVEKLRAHPLMGAALSGSMPEIPGMARRVP